MCILRRHAHSTPQLSRDACWSGCRPRIWLAAGNCFSKRRWVRSAYVAEEDDHRVVGFAAAGPTRVPCLGQAGELYAIYLLPERQRQGVGRLLFARTVEALAGQSGGSFVARVFAANPARRFFEVVGGTQVPLLGCGSPKIAYMWDCDRAEPSLPVRTG
jgi:GNAT superfamily N-acetyltransferase